MISPPSGFLFAQQQAQQRGLARAVASREADALARLIMKGNLVKQGRPADMKTQLPHSE